MASENLKNRILIINPPTFDKKQYIKEGRCESKKGGQLTPQITLGIISALLTRDGIYNELYDFMAESSGFQEILKKRYDKAFINISAPTYESDKQVAHLLKRSGCTTISLGVLSTALPELVLEDFDVAILGEPEIAALEISKGEKISAIDGIAYKNGTRIIKNESRKIENLDMLPFPDRDMLPVYLNPRTGRPFTAIKVERGCPFSCSFCTAPFYYGKKPRYRSIGNVISEIELCKSKYRINDFFFLSDTFTINQGYVKELCEKIIEKDLNISWTCNSRVDTITQELAYIMQKAGCYLISFGVESGTERIIKENMKNLDLSKAKTAADICSNAGIKSMMYYILGFPNETKQEMENTLRLSLNVRSDLARFFVATPLPGSRLYNNRPNLSELNLSDTSCNLSGVPEKELKEMVRKAYLSWYLRPSSLLKALWTFETPWHFIKTALDYALAYMT